MMNALLLFICLLSLVASKHVVGKLQLSSQVTEQYIAKFSLQQGATGLIMANFSVDGADPYFDNHPHKLQLTIFNDADWAVFQKQLTEGSLCNQRIKEDYKRTFLIHPVHYDPNNEQKSVQFSHAIKPTEITEFYYFLVSDCYLEEYDAHPGRMTYKISFLHNGSQLPAHESGLPAFYTCMTIFLFLFSSIYGYFVSKNVGSLGQLHLIVILLGTAIVSQLTSVFCETIHLYVYLQNGFGLRWKHSYIPLDFFAEILQGLSELIVAFVLIALSFGWTIAIPKLASSSFQAFYRFSGTSFLCFTGMALIQVTLELLGRGYEDDFNQFHDFEHWPGYLLILFRLSQFGIFGYGVRSTLKYSNEDATTSFFYRLAIFGTLWFVTFPVMVVVSSFLPSYWRHSFVTGSAIFAQSLALMLLTKLMLSKGQYYKISSMSQMGTVFGGESFKSRKIGID